MLKRFLTLATVMLSLFIGGTTIKADSHGETVTNYNCGAISTKYC